MEFFRTFVADFVLLADVVPFLDEN